MRRILTALILPVAAMLYASVLAHRAYQSAGLYSPGVRYAMAVKGE